MIKSNTFAANIDYDGRDVIDVVPVVIAQKAVTAVAEENSKTLSPERYIVKMIDKYHRPNVSEFEKFRSLMTLQDFMRLLALAETYFNITISCFAALKTYQSGSVLNLIEFINLILEERKNGR